MALSSRELVDLAAVGKVPHFVRDDNSVAMDNVRWLETSMKKALSSRTK
jgi:hypothetical protein